LPCTFLCPQVPLNSPTGKTGTLRSPVLKKNRTDVWKVLFWGASYEDQLILRGSNDPLRGIDTRGARGRKLALWAGRQFRRTLAWHVQRSWRGRYHRPTSAVSVPHRTPLLGYRGRPCPSPHWQPVATTSVSRFVCFPAWPPTRPLPTCHLPRRSCWTRRDARR